MMCLRTFTEKNLSSFESWEKWVEFVNSNWEYSKTESTIDDFIGKCEDWQLPSFHPYWKNEALKDILKYADKLEEWLNICRADNSQLKYYFNKTATIESVEQHIAKLRKKGGDRF